VLPDAPVTRGEFQEFRGEVQREFQAVRGEFQEFRGEVRREFQAFRGELHAFKGDYRDFQLRVFETFESQSERIDRATAAVEELRLEMNGRFDDVFHRFLAAKAENAAIIMGLQRIEDLIRNPPKA
jgi:hypothetical protein